MKKNTILPPNNIISHVDKFSIDNEESIALGLHQLLEKFGIDSDVGVSLDSDTRTISVSVTGRRLRSYKVAQKPQAAERESLHENSATV